MYFRLAFVVLCAYLAEKCYGGREIIGVGWLNCESFCDEELIISAYDIIDVSITTIMSKQLPILYERFYTSEIY